jgi:hypothetical protein
VTRWFVVPLLALFAACGADGEPSLPGTGGSGGATAGSGAKGGAAGAGRAGKGGENAGGTDAGTAGSDAGSGGSSGDGEGAAAGTGGANAGRGGTSASGGTSAGDGGAGGDDPGGVPAASVAIVGGDFALALGAEVTLAAEARDAEGNVVAAEITWHSSDPSVASVSAGLVVGVGLGRAEITASADGVTSTAVVVWVNPAQSTGSAIRDAVTAGTLTEDEALVYRVFALFRDGRLPGEYWSTLPEDPDADHRLMLEVNARFDALSESQQQAIGTYLVPPAYAPRGRPDQSALLAISNPPTRLAARPADCSGVINSGWVNVDRDHFRIWYTPGVVARIDRAWAELVGDHAEAAYREFVTVRGFRAPVPDGGLCNGGDGRIDIYLPFYPIGARGLTTPIDPFLGTTSSAYIEISPDVDLGDLRGVVAHEFMHVLQSAYPNVQTASYTWVGEGTATWAQAVVVPGSSTYLHFARQFLNRVHEPLFFPNHDCASSLAGAACTQNPSSQLKMYGSYLFFQYIEQRIGDGTIKNFFDIAAAYPESLQALNLVLAGQGGLTGIWAEFARTLWNRDPIAAGSSFRGWDGQTASLGTRTGFPEYQSLPTAGIQALARVPSIVTNGGTRERTLPLNELSASFDHYTFDPEVRSVTFYNGFSLKMGKKPFSVNSSSGKTLDAGEQFIVYDTTEEEIKGREVWALIKIDGSWTLEDWSRYPFFVYCRDKASERLEELVLIFSNGNYTTARGTAAGDDFAANAIGPRGDERAAVLASAAPCWKYKGKTEASLSYERAGDAFDVTNTLEASFIGEPHLGRATTTLGTGYVFLGYRFTNDIADTRMTSRFVGSFASCGNSAVRDGTAEYSGSELGKSYDFNSFLTIPDGSNQNRYSGRSGAFQWVLQECAGGDKRLSAPAIVDFDLNFESLLSVEAVGSTDAALRGTDQLGPVVDPGAYTNVPDVKNNWCFEALREGEPEPTTCD